MDRLFLDANVLFSAAFRPDSGLLVLWKFPDVALCSSRYALEEARANLADENQRLRLVKLSEAVEFFEAGLAAFPRSVSLPPKDAPILRAAFAARATHLLTGDIRHFGPYFGKQIGIAVMRPADYIKSKTKHAGR
jgi:predicted nucleic acid-binding protein